MKSKLTVFSWAFYDFANTIFAVNVVSLYFALWVTVDKAGKDIYYSIAIAVSMVFAAIGEPLMGAFSDKAGRRMPFLFWFTAASVVFTALIGFSPSLLSGLIFFTLANFTYNMCLVFYNSLLPEIAKERNIGKISGFGISMSYAGTIAGLYLVKPFVDAGGRQAAFIPAALFFLLFSIPCFLFVRDVTVDRGPLTVDHKRPKIRDALKSLKDTFVNRDKHPGLFTFLVANFICLDAVTTTIPFISIFAKKALAMTDGEIRFFLVLSTLFAIFGSYISGLVSDRIGPKKTWAAVMWMWCAAFFLAATFLDKNIFWVVGPVSGVSIGATWVTTRALAAKLAPPEKRGEIFGLFGVVSKTAAIIGPLIWGLITWLGEPLGILRYRIAVYALLGLAGFGLWLIRKIPEQ